LGLQLALHLSLARSTGRHSRLRFAMRHDKQNGGTGKDFPRLAAAMANPALLRLAQAVRAGRLREGYIG
jgi:hypothetical protein